MTSLFERVLSRLTPREKLEMALALAVLVVAVLGYVVVMPLQRWFAQENTAIRAAERRMSSNEMILASGMREAILQEYRQYESYMKKNGTTAAENADLFGTVEALGRQSGVKLVGARPREPRDLGDREEYALEIDVEAGLTNNLIRFLHGLQTAPQLLRVESLDVSPKAGSASGEVKGTLLITRVVILEEAPGGTPASTTSSPGKG